MPHEERNTKGEISHVLSPPHQLVRARQRVDLAPGRRSFLEVWDGDVVHRDLATSPVPHISEALITARLTEPAQHTEEQAAASALQDELIEEFLGARAYLFTVPMYNLSMPSAFKAWLDHIMVFGRTFKPSPTIGRPAVLISARGGSYAPGAPKHGLDFVVPAVETVLGHADQLALDVSTVIPELTMASHNAALADLLPKHEASMVAAHERARRLAAEIIAAPAA